MSITEPTFCASPKMAPKLASVFGVVLAMAVALGGAACGTSGSDDGEDDPLEGWELTWSDEFDGEADTLPDPEVWTFDVGGNGFGNEQLEFNTDRAENASLDGDGNLAIVARRENYQGNSYTSARIKTQNSVEVEYGRVEARILLPFGQGIWPAFWMLGNDFETIGWPQCGEIDVMEYRGQNPALVYGTAHGPGYSGARSLGEVTAVSGGAASNFHVYAVEWEPEEIRWYVDGVLYHSLTPAQLPPGSAWVYDHPFFLILNVAVGGYFVGAPDASTQFPQTMLVDYVRVYERQQ